MRNLKMPSTMRQRASGGVAAARSAVVFIS
jgi:hypothetical protein